MSQEQIPLDFDTLPIHIETTTSTRWSEIAWMHAQAYLAGLSSGTPVTAERMRIVAEEHGCPVPVDRRAWGGVINRAASARLVVKTDDQVRATLRNVHRQLITQWVRS